MASKNTRLSFLYILFYARVLYLFLAEVISRATNLFRGDLVFRNYNFIYSLSYLFILLNIAGIPPFPGFYLKVLILEHVFTMEGPTLRALAVLALGNLYLTYIYLQFIYFITRFGKFNRPFKAFISPYYP